MDIQVYTQYFKHNMNFKGVTSVADSFNTGYEFLGKVIIWEYFR